MKQFEIRLSLVYYVLVHGENVYAYKSRVMRDKTRTIIAHKSWPASDEEAHAKAEAWCQDQYDKDIQRGKVK